MSAVDGMLQVMVDTGGRSMRLAAGSPARIVDAAGTMHEGSSQALTRQEILQLIGPIVPEEARRRLWHEPARVCRAASRRTPPALGRSWSGDRGGLDAR